MSGGHARMMFGIEPRLVTGTAPAVGGVRRDDLLPVGDKAPKLGGVRIDLDPTDDKAPPVGGVKSHVRTIATRMNRIALALSLVLHAAALGWATQLPSNEEARAVGGNGEPIVIEGISIILLDSLPSAAASREEPLPEALQVADIASIARVDDTPADRVAEVEVAALPAQAVEADADFTDVARSDDVSTQAVADDVVSQHIAGTAPPKPAAEVLSAISEAEDHVPPPVAARAVPLQSAASVVKALHDTIAAPASAAEAPRTVTEDTAKPVRIEETRPAPLREVAALPPAANDAPLRPIEDSEQRVTIPDEPAPPAARTPPPVERMKEPAPKKPAKRAQEKKVAAVKAAPSEASPASIAEQAARGPDEGSAGAGGRSSEERGRADLSSYRAQLGAHLRRYRSYPESARREGISGTARVSFTVNANGQVTAARLSGSSGHSVLDEAAIGMVRRASPFPRIPPHLSKSALTVDVPVRFDRQ